MINNESRKSTAADRLAAALDQWEGEGGAKTPQEEKRDRRIALADEERRVLLCLGAAVIMQWNELPRDIQRELFERAVITADPRRSASLKEQIARFLHTHKDDEPGPR